MQAFSQEDNMEEVSVEDRYEMNVGIEEAIRHHAVVNSSGHHRIKTRATLNQQLVITSRRHHLTVLETSEAERMMKKCWLSAFVESRSMELLRKRCV